MAKTLLNAVNEVLKRVGQIHGDSEALTTLVSTARQRSIDVSAQVINEGIDELYTVNGMPKPIQQAESTITLATGTRAYDLASDLVRLRYSNSLPIIDKTNTQFLFPYPGGYNQLIVDDPEQDWEGQPQFAVIRPTDAKLYVAPTPTSEHNGKVYTYQYDKELELTVAADEVPFGDTVFRAMVPVWVQLYRRDMDNEFDNGLFKLSIGRAARLLSKRQPREHYSPRC